MRARCDTHLASTRQRGFDFIICSLSLINYQSRYGFCEAIPQRQRHGKFLTLDLQKFQNLKSPDLHDPTIILKT